MTPPPDPLLYLWSLLDFDVERDLPQLCDVVVSLEQIGEDILGLVVLLDQPLQLLFLVNLSLGHSVSQDILHNRRDQLVQSSVNKIGQSLP